jgi:hypothetical protein
MEDKPSKESLQRDKMHLERYIDRVKRDPALLKPSATVVREKEERVMEINRLLKELYNVS